MINCHLSKISGSHHNARSDLGFGSPPSIRSRGRTTRDIPGERRFPYSSESDVIHRVACPRVDESCCVVHYKGLTDAELLKLNLKFDDDIYFKDILQASI